MDQMLHVSLRAGQSGIVLLKKKKMMMMTTLYASFANTPISSKKV